MVQQLLEVRGAAAPACLPVVCHRGLHRPRRCLGCMLPLAALAQLWPHTLGTTSNSHGPQPINPSTATRLPGSPQEMSAAGLHVDAVAHTILLMAHEKAGAWEAALECYATMQSLGLQSNSFTYRQAAKAWLGGAGEEGPHGTGGWPGYG